MANVNNSNRHSLTHKLDIYEWLSSQQEKLRKDQPTFKDAAVQCSEALGFKVSVATLSDMLDAKPGLRWEPKPVFKANSGSGSKLLWESIKQQRAELDECKKLIEQLLLDNSNLHAQCAVLRGELVTACKQASIRPPSFAVRNDAPKAQVANKAGGEE